MDRIRKCTFEKPIFQMMKIRIIFLIPILIFSCTYGCNSNQSNIEGIYVGQNFTKNIDSIYILPNGIYERSIYSNEKELIFRNRSTYKRYETHLSFSNFLLNKNDVSISDNYNPNDLLNVLLNININFQGKIKLMVDYDLDYYYLKTK